MKRIGSIILAGAMLLSLVGCAVDTPQDEMNTPPVQQDTLTLSDIAPCLTQDEYPRVDGSTVTIPLSEYVYSVTCGVDMDEARKNVLHNKTHNAYVNLIEGKSDIIFVTYPSAEEMQMAKDAGIELEIVPVVKDAFVFLLNTKNPVDTLTSEEIQMIYGGYYTDWSRFGGNQAPIIPYQRPVNSGSQSGMLALVMNGKEIMDAPIDMQIGGMGDLIETIASYDNGENAIGYSYYYYAEAMYSRDTTKYVKVNGVEPNNTTISNGTYPYCTAYYAVINKASAKDSPQRKLLDFILSDEGQFVAKEAGYVPLR